MKIHPEKGSKLISNFLELHKNGYISVSLNSLKAKNKILDLSNKKSLLMCSDSILIFERVQEEGYFYKYFTMGIRNLLEEEVWEREWNEISLSLSPQQADWIENYRQKVKLRSLLQE